MEIFELTKENREWWITQGDKVFKPCHSRRQARMRIDNYFFQQHPHITKLRITYEVIKDES